jgi:hypothetical protein
MKRILIILIIGFVFATVQAQMDNPLKKGMPNTKTLSTGEMVYDINGEWDAITDGGFGKMENILKITQEGNKFVGIKLIGNEHKPKGSETIKGRLEKDGFLFFFLKTVSGWTPSTVKIGEKCNKIEIKTRLPEGDDNILYIT